MFKKNLSKLNPEQKDFIRLICSQFSLQDVQQWVKKLENLKVLVTGEPIIDSYIFCESIGLSTKSPTVSTRYLYREDYSGGSWAIAAHLKQLGCDVSMLYTGGQDEKTQTLENNLKKTGIKISNIHIDDVITPLKTRYMVPLKGQKIFELVELKSDQWAKHDSLPFTKELLSMAETNDLIVMCDYGHGLFEDKVLAEIKKISTFIALNVQSNSANYGFNLFTKHQHYNYLAIDERELRLALHDRINSLPKLSQKACNRLINKPFSITEGAKGSTFHNIKGQPFHCPIFIEDVVDTIGSGDAYFALTSCLVRVGTPEILVPFLGNIHAGLKARIMGNKEAVLLDDMMTFVEEIYDYAS